MHEMPVLPLHHHNDACTYMSSSFATLINKCQSSRLQGQGTVAKKLGTCFPLASWLLLPCIGCSLN